MTSSKRQRVDVLILGGGVAGAVTALSLARRGASVGVLDRSRPRPLLGEGLPPGSNLLLQELGLWDAFQRGGHIESPGNRSLWGSSQQMEYDFIRSPYGPGRHLDRGAFDRMLVEAAQEAGAEWSSPAKVSTWWQDRKRTWTVTWTGEGRQREIRAGFVVDATGRARSFSRSQDAGRVRYDRLVAITDVLQPTATAADTNWFTAVEATEHGWWYTSCLPDDRRVVAFVTDADIARSLRAGTSEGWSRLLSQTAHISQLVPPTKFALQGGPYPVPADSSRLEPASGPGWCAVGDAAAAHDPLSSRGILMAMQSGMQTARAILGDRRIEIPAYERWLNLSYARYLAEWLGYYWLEQRWPGSPFWQRRHALMRTLFRDSAA